MRRYYLVWAIGVFGIVGTVYGAYSLIYHFNHGNGLVFYALLLLIVGILALVAFLVFNVLVYLDRRKKKNQPIPSREEKAIEEEPKVEEEKKPEVEEKKKPEEPKSEPTSTPTPRPEREESVSRTRVSYGSSIYDSAPTIYVKQVGYGPLLRIEGGRIVDMRTNTYYRFEGNVLMQDGYGPVFEIRGNQIRSAFGGYLYELSGSNINKVFGGYYASVSGNYITVYDLSVKYETTDSLSKRQILAVAALLFGAY